MSYSHSDKWKSIMSDVPRYLEHESRKIRARGETLMAVDKILRAAAYLDGHLDDEFVSLKDAVEDFYRRRS